MGYFWIICIVLFGLTITAADVPHRELMSRIKRSSERDPYVFNLFEVILSTLESKLLKVENMDKTMEHLIRRLDHMEGQLSLTLNTTTKIAHLLDVRLDSGCFKATETVQAPKQVTRVVRHRPYAGLFFEQASPQPRKIAQITLNNGFQQHQRPTSQRFNNHGPIYPTEKKFLDGQVSINRANQFNIQELKKPSHLSESKMEIQLDQVAKRVAIIDTKLSTLQEQLDANTIVKPEELLASASESYRIGVGIDDKLQGFRKIQDLAPIENAVEDIRNSLESVNRRIQIHSDSSGQSFGFLSKEFLSLKAMLEEVVRNKHSPVCPVGNGLIDKSSDIDEIKETSKKILDKIITPKDIPTLDPQNFIDEQAKQGKAIDGLKKDLSQRSTRILSDIEEVKREIRRALVSPRENSNTINPVALLQRVQNEPVDSVVAGSSPPSDLLDQRILEENNSTDSDEASNMDRSRHSGVIFPQKHKKPVESAFVAPMIKEEIQGYSCKDLLKKGKNESGTYHLKIRGTTYWFLQVYCDMKTADGGWTVIQRRDDFGEPRESFIRNWAEYKHGFGQPEKEFWLGNENIYMLTNTEDYTLRVELEDFDGSKRYAEYDSFKLHDETDLYKLEIGGYNGTAGDALSDPWYGSNLSPFSTFDKDNDRSSLNCASMLKGGWWWRSCGRGLNGLYLTNPNDFTARQGIVWFRWRGWDYTLKRTTLMIRPKSSEPKST